MKRFFAAALAAVMTAAASVFPAAAKPEIENELPFKLTAPEHVSVTYLNERDSLNTCEIAYSQSSEMSAFFSAFDTDYDKAHDAILEKGFDEISIEAQIDWSLDSQDDWKVNDYWLSEGYDDEFHQHLGDWAYISESYAKEISMSTWIFRWMGNIDDPEDAFWFADQEGVGNTGWSTVLKDGQYDIVETDDGHTAKIDLTKHTIYTRVRWLVTSHRFEADENKVTVSDWSEVASVGKDAVKAEPLKPGDVAAPQISNLHYTDKEFNDQPIIAFTLTVDDKLVQQLTQASGTQGSIWLAVEAKTESMSEWYELQGDWEVKTGEMEMKLIGMEQAAGGRIEAGTPIQLRARYCVSQNNQDDFYTDYSEVLTFGAQLQTTIPEQTVTEAGQTTTLTAAAQEQEKSGSLWWLWLLLILLIIIIIIIIILLSRKKDDENKEAAQPKTQQQADEQKKE